jgi:hypothetical protein
LRADDKVMTHYAATFTHEDPLSAARGLFVGGILSVLMWVMILAATGQIG